MDRLVMVAVILVVAVAVALAAQRRRPAAPTNRRSEPPTQVDRADFPRPEAPWLVAVFTSATCDACAAVWQRAAVLESPEVCVVDLEFGAAADLHRRYGIDSVPTTLLVNSLGEVGQSFIGPVSSTHLWAALAELREPGSVPGGCEMGDHEPPDAD